MIDRNADVFESGDRTGVSSNIRQAAREGGAYQNQALMTTTVGENRFIEEHFGGLSLERSDGVEGTTGSAGSEEIASAATAASHSSSEGAAASKDAGVPRANLSRAEADRGSIYGGESGTGYGLSDLENSGYGGGLAALSDSRTGSGTIASINDVYTFDASSGLGQASASTGAQGAADMLNAGYGTYGDYSSFVQQQGAAYPNDATDAAKAGNQTFAQNGITGYFWNGDSNGNLTLNRTNPTTGQGEPLATTNVGAEPGGATTTSPTADNSTTNTNPDAPTTASNTDSSTTTTASNADASNASSAVTDASSATDTTLADNSIPSLDDIYGGDMGFLSMLDDTSWG